MTREPYSLNGKFKGAYYRLEDGRSIFLSHQSARLRLKSNAWGISDYALRQCAAKEIQYAGVVIRDGSRRLYFLARVSDFYGPDSFCHFAKDGIQRALPIRSFALTPADDRETLMKRAEIGR